MNQVQFSMPPMTKTNKVILIVLAAFFLLEAILKGAAGFSLMGFLALSLPGLKTGIVTQLVTWPLYSTGLFQVLFSGLIFWFLGCELENLWGTRKYISFIIGLTLVSGFLFAIIALFMGLNGPIFGVGALASAMCVAYAYIYPERQFLFMFFFPMAAKYFCLLMAAIVVFQSFTSVAKHMFIVDLLAMALGFAFVFLNSRGKLGFMERGGSPKRGSGGWGDLGKKKKKHLKLVKEDDDEPPKYWH